MKLGNIPIGAILAVLFVSSTWHTVLADDTYCFDVNCGQSLYDFNSTPIDANFFYIGSDAFDGIVPLNGPNVTGPDVRIERLDSLDFNDSIPSVNTVPIELVELNLQSCAPITITGTDPNNRLWIVDVNLSVIPTPNGVMTVTKTHSNGGTFTSEFNVQPRFTFTRIDPCSGLPDPCEVRILDTGLVGDPSIKLLNIAPYPWVHDSIVKPPPCDGNGFYPTSAKPLEMRSTDSKFVMELSPPFTRQSMIFVSDRDEPGNWDIYIMDVDDTSGPNSLPVVRRLTTNTGIDNHPGLSHDGTKVVWSSNRNTDGNNPEGDFEIFIADFDDVNDLEAGNVTQLTSNDYPDRHPHFNHGAGKLKIIHSAKYICVETKETIIVSECSIPREVTIISPCGRKCEGLKIMDANDSDGNNVGDNLIEIDHDVLSAINPLLWPPRDPNDARWVGHPSFSHDDTQIIFSGAVDGQGRNWEVYVMDWNDITATVSNLRQVTDESLYPDNDNPIKMSAGAYFSEDDSTILFTSTRTEFGNSQLFVVPSSADKVPVSPGNRHPFSSDMANVYVPELLSDGRIVLTTDLEEFTGLNSCQTQCDPLLEYVVGLDPCSAHTIRIEAAGVPSPGNTTGPNDFRIHLDAYELDGTVLQESEDANYSGSWSIQISPTASDVNYAVTDGNAGQYVDINVPDLISSVTLQLGRTPFSGIAKIYVDGVPITDGDVNLIGDVDPNKSGIDLYIPFYSTSDDLDLLIIAPDGSSKKNLTDNDDNDELLLIGDEVSWFCGIKPNLSPCTYYPKYFTVGQLKLMRDSNSLLPENYPGRSLYPFAYSALEEFMTDNSLRPHLNSYWSNVCWEMDFGDPNKLVVLPTPVNFCIQNQAPNEPNNPVADSNHNDQSLSLSVSPTTDPDGDPITYDIYLGQEGGALLVVENDTNVPSVTLDNQPFGRYSWRTVTKDDMGGIMYSQILSFCHSVSLADLDCDFKVDFLDFGILAYQWLQPPGDPSADIAPPEGDDMVGFEDLALFSLDWLKGTE